MVEWLKLYRSDPDNAVKQMQAAVTHGGDRTVKQVTTGHLNMLGPNTTKCIVRRLKRDAPAIAAAALSENL